MVEHLAEVSGLLQVPEVDSDESLFSPLGSLTVVQGFQISLIQVVPDHHQILIQLPRAVLEFEDPCLVVSELGIRVESNHHGALLQGLQ